MGILIPWAKTVSLPKGSWNDQSRQVMLNEYNEVENLREQVREGELTQGFDSNMNMN